MKFMLIFYMLFVSFSKSQDNPVLNLNNLLDEALQNNLELNSLLHNRKAIEKLVGQESYFENPDLTFRLMEIPGFKPNEAMFANLELMQMFPFPLKTKINKKILTTESDITYQLYNEKAVEIIMDVKVAYYELWMVQRKIELNKLKQSLIQQAKEIVQEKYRTGLVKRQEILDVEVEFTKAQIESLELIDAEESAYAMLASLLNKDIRSFKGSAMIPDTIIFNFTQEQIASYALKNCSRLRSDSLKVEKFLLLNQLAKSEYFPNFKIGVEYVTSPMTGFRGWSFLAGISLPFAFWTIDKTNAKVNETEFNILSARANYHNERNMLLSKVRKYFAKLTSLHKQLQLYNNKIIPLLEQKLNITLQDYQTDRSDFQSYLNTFVMYTEEKMESIMIRAKFEKTLAELEKEIGCRDIEEILNY